MNDNTYIHIPVTGGARAIVPGRDRSLPVPWCLGGGH